MRGGDGHLVLVLEPVLAVNGDDGVDDILCSLREHILIGKVDDGGFLLAQAGNERALDAVGHRIDIAAGYIELRSIAILYKLGIGRSLIYLDLSQWGVDDLSEASGNLIAVIYRKIITGYALEPADDVRAIALELNLEAAALLIGKADEIYGHGEIAAIERLLVEGTVDGIIYIELEPLSGFQEHGRRLDGNEFIVYIALSASHSHICEHGRNIAADALRLAVVLDHQGCGALIYVWGSENVIGGDAERYGERKDEPAPLGEAEIEEILQADEVVCLVTSEQRIHLCGLVSRSSILYHFSLLIYFQEGEDGNDER